MGFISKAGKRLATFRRNKRIDPEDILWFSKSARIQHSRAILEEARNERWEREFIEKQSETRAAIYKDMQAAMDRARNDFLAAREADAATGQDDEPLMH